MERVNFTQFDEYPEAMLEYMKHYGPHFNRKLHDFAVSLMTVMQNGKEERLKPYTRQEVGDILKTHKINVENGQLYDIAYVANMCKADFLGKSVPNEIYLAMYVKDVIDDVDAPDGLVFNRWYADMCYKGIAIDWEDML